MTPFPPASPNTECRPLTSRFMTSTRQGLITLEEALGNSTNPDEFKLRIAGISNTADAAREEMEKASQVDRFAKR